MTFVILSYLLMDSDENAFCVRNERAECEGFSLKEMKFLKKKTVGTFNASEVINRIQGK
jgi:hypothetical protein